RVFSQQPALEYQSILFRRPISNVAMTYDPLIRIDPDYRCPEYDPGDLCNPHIGDFEIRRAGQAVYVLRRLSQHGLCARPARASPADSASSHHLQEVAPVGTGTLPLVAFLHN